MLRTTGAGTTERWRQGKPGEGGLAGTGKNVAALIPHNEPDCAPSAPRALDKQVQAAGCPEASRAARQPAPSSWQRCPGRLRIRCLLPPGTQVWVERQGGKSLAAGRGKPGLLSEHHRPADSSNTVHTGRLDLGRFICTNQDLCMRQRLLTNATSSASPKEGFLMQAIGNADNQSISAT